MNEPRRVSILTGSTRGGRTTSQSVGEYLAERLMERGVQSEAMRVRNALESEQGIADMLAAIERADVFQEPRKATSLLANTGTSCGEWVYTDVIISS
jgi:hypothetical protein